MRLETGFEENGMQEQFADGRIMESENRFSISWFFSDNLLFDHIKYQVMKNQMEGRFLPCRLVRYNGNYKLVYMLENLMPMNVYLLKCDGRAAVQAVCEILRTYEEVDNNELLVVEDVDSRTEHIYIDAKQQHIYLLYLPVEGESNASKNYEEQMNLRLRIVNALREGTNRMSWEVIELSRLLSDTSIISLGMLEEKIRGLGALNGIPSAIRHGKSGYGIQEGHPKKIRLYSADGEQQFVVDMPHFIMGRNPERADGVIRGNLSVGRVHCVLLYENGRWFAEDSDSKNGTWVNGRRLMPGERIEIRPDDVLKLANAAFYVQECWE